MGSSELGGGSVEILGCTRCREDAGIENGKGNGDEGGVSNFGGCMRVCGSTVYCWSAV